LGNYDEVLDTLKGKAGKNTMRLAMQNNLSSLKNLSLSATRPNKHNGRGTKTDAQWFSPIQSSRRAETFIVILDRILSPH
jgi:hypothetical protein